MDEISEVDKKLFRDTVDQQKPLDKDIYQNPVNSNTPVFSNIVNNPSSSIDANKYIRYAKTGVSKKLLNQIKKGKVGHCPELDLHGQTVNEASLSIYNFINSYSNKRFLHIIHGKGYHTNNNASILKAGTVSHLKKHHLVLAFCSCPQKNGGTGALFILLKKS